EVLPTLVWPTTASFSGSVMAMLQPVQRRAVGERQRQCAEGVVPVLQALGVQRAAGARLQQPDAGLGGAAREFGDQRQGATVRRAPWVAGDGQALGREARQLFKQLPTLLTAVEYAGAGHAGGQGGRPGLIL